MPELPEVETIRQDLLSYVLNKKIQSVDVKKEKLVKNQLNFFYSNLEGQKFIDIERIGKLLMFILDNDKILLLHLKMTGQLIFKDKNNFVAGGHSQSDFDLDVPNKYSHIIFNFKDGAKLFFNDMRQFAYLKIIKKEEKLDIIKEYGIEPLQKNWTWENFLTILAKHPNAKIKAFLLNQKYISGLGNIYVDESCFCAEILPGRLVKSLKKKELRKLFHCIEKIIIKALKFKGTTFRDYRTATGEKGNFSEQLLVFEHKGDLCSRCQKGIIEKTRLAGRGTYFCPNCQK
jgi:formamidopyrimidine-DNA glycosylase